MKRIRQIDELADIDRSGSLAIGNFDGVHLGHARIISRLVAQADSLQGPSVVFTFEPHPASVLRPQQVSERLVTVDRKLELLEQLGVDVVIVYPTDKQLLELSAETFFETIVLSGLDARVIVEGTNFSFGRNREGTIEKLETLCCQHQVQLELVQPVELDGEVVSSSRLRRLVSRGDLETVNGMLTRPYRVRGRIQPGAGRGQELGFPTANLGELTTLLPADGVYAGCGYIDGKSWPAAVNIGGNPTFEDPAAKFEVHLVGFSGSRYGEMIEIELLTRLRDVRRFEDPGQLRLQIEEDVQQAREAAGEVSGNLNK